jgi:hypothetical protein
MILKTLLIFLIFTNFQCLRGILASDDLDLGINARLIEHDKEKSHKGQRNEFEGRHVEVVEDGEFELIMNFEEKIIKSE